MKEGEATYGRTAVYDASDGGAMALAVGCDSKQVSKGRHREGEGV